MSYNVVFVDIRENSIFKGLRSWMSFDSKDDFETYYTKNRQTEETVLEEGISGDQAVELIRRIR